ncbi:hypothetical protein R1sor_007770 [Riccia sorocarpa]|uniref:Ycf20-like protein n=1 Tax=Riccia sorocarpa TaxID=122646 RepID=A0ABD3HTV7_9MARC
MEQLEAGLTAPDDERDTGASEDQNLYRMAVLRSSSLATLQRPTGLSTLEVFQKPSPTFAIVQTTLPSAYHSSWGIASARWRSKGQLEQLQGYKSVSSTRLNKKAGKSTLVIEALQGAGRPPRRLVEVIRAIPRLSRAYFKSPFRRALYAGIALLGGFYVAQTISLSFGALGVNDVIAAAVCVLFAEYVTRFYYTREKVTFTVGLLNNFKMGFTYGLFIDAFKLAS